MKYVIKIGTSSLFNEDGTSKEIILKDLLETVRKIFNEGHDVVIVVSGAVVCGKAILRQIVENLEKNGKTNNIMYDEYKKLQEKIDFIKRLRVTVAEYEKTEGATNSLFYMKCKELLEKAKLTIVEKSIIAGIGQNEMMRIIQKEALECGILTEQMLLSGKKDLKRSIAVENIRQCFQRRILAVVNANDTVYEEELADEGNEKFSDNDNLASDLAKEIKADRLFFITNVDGYLDNSNEVVKEITVDKGVDYLKKTKLTTSVVGSGGMYSKLENALSFAKSGGISFIISAKEISNILEIGELKIRVGTKVCNNVTLIEKAKIIVKNNIENGGILKNECSNKQANERYV